MAGVVAGIGVLGGSRYRFVRFGSHIGLLGVGCEREPEWSGLYGGVYVGEFGDFLIRRCSPAIGAGGYRDSVPSRQFSQRERWNRAVLGWRL